MLGNLKIINIFIYFSVICLTHQKDLSCPQNSHQAFRGSTVTIKYYLEA